MFCAFWSISAFFFPTKTNRDSTTNYTSHFDELDIEGIDFSKGLSFKDITK